MAFLLDVLRAWRDDSVLVPLDGSLADPVLPALPPDIAHVKSTSGSTGCPRLVMFTADQLAADAGNILRTMQLRRDWPNAAVVSMAHSYGFSNLVLPLLLHGIPIVLLSDPLPATLEAAQKAVPALTVPAVPAMWRTWQQAGVIGSGIRLAISAGAPLPLEVEATVFSKTGVKIHNFYGSSECGGIAYDRTDTPRTEAGCAGTALDGVRLSVSRNSGCLCIESAAVASGYVDPDPALSGGRFETADLAEIRDDGSVVLTGRRGDTINVAGRKIPPSQIEDRLLKVPGVRYCVVFGVPSPDPARVEEIVACVNPAPDTSLDDIRRAAAALLPKSDHPRHWFGSPDVAPDSRGKIPRASWRERWLRQHPTGTAGQQTGP